MLSCALLSEARNGNVSQFPFFVSNAFMPVTADACAEGNGDSVVFKSLSIEAFVPTSNFFMPSMHCTDGLVPSPRPTLNMGAGKGGREMTAFVRCPVEYAAVRTWAQSENEEPRCPGDACSSPALRDSDWEATNGAYCLLREALD